MRSIRCEGNSSPYDGVRSSWLQLLSYLRAQSACDYLRTLGFDVPMTVIGYGTRHPRTDNGTIDHEQLNSRVEIIVTR